jgi:hypothetical protein
MIKKIFLKGQPTDKKKLAREPPSQPIVGHGGMYLSSQATQEAEIRRIQASLGKKQDPISKIKN